MSFAVLVQASVKQIDMLENAAHKIVSEVANRSAAAGESQTAAAKVLKDVVSGALKHRMYVGLRGLRYMSET